jgi:heme-degrading monooxygenase HmoA
LPCANLGRVVPSRDQDEETCVAGARGARASGSEHRPPATLQPSTRRRTMFIAMNRFRVKKGSEEDFEKVWLSRDSHLDKVPGFVEFHLLKGPEHDDFTLYASHTIWQNRATFEAWTKSEAFRAAHRDAGQNKPLYLDHPQFEGFEVRQTVGRGKAAVA